MHPPFPESIWTPIAPDRPGGHDLAFAPERDEIQAARQGDDPDLAQGEWARTPRAPQWGRVRGLCEAILGGRSKDLQVACWYTEALAHTDGFAGLAHGLRTVEILLDRFWATCHPALAAGPGPDWEERSGRIEWLDRNGAAAVGRIPLTARTAGGHGLLDWRESRRVDNLGLRGAAAREAALQEGRLSGEAFDQAAAASGPAHFQRLAGELEAAAEACAALRATVDRRFVPDPPSLAALAEAIQDCRAVVEPIRDRLALAFREPEPLAPDAPEPEPPPSRTPAPAVRVPAGPERNPSADPTPARPEAPAPALPDRTRPAAIREVRQLAGWFRSREPHSPVPALLERAADWAEMPLDRWLGDVVKDPATLAQLRELLALDH